MNEATRIRTELLAQHYIQQLPSIQNLLLHIEAKGRSPNTIRAYEQNLKALAQWNNDLQKTKIATNLLFLFNTTKKGKPSTR